MIQLKQETMAKEWTTSSLSLRSGIVEGIEQGERARRLPAALNVTRV